jgi:hypothetical protein
MAKKSIPITLYKSELVSEIKNKTFLTARSRSTGTNHEEVAHMQADDGNDEDRLQIYRSVENSIATLMTKLSEFIDIEVGSVDNNLDDTIEAETFVINLTMPSNYNEATATTVKAEAHQFVVNKSVAAWFQITDKADADDYETKAAANIEGIREAIYKRVRPVRVSPVKEEDTTTSTEDQQS